MCQRVFARSREQLCRNYNHTNSGGILNPKTVHTGEVGFVASSERRVVFFCFAQHPFFISPVCLVAQGQVAGAGGQPSVLSDSCRGCFRAGSQVDLFFSFLSGRKRLLPKTVQRISGAKFARYYSDAPAFRVFFQCRWNCTKFIDHDNK